MEQAKKAQKKCLYRISLGSAKRRKIFHWPRETFLTFRSQIIYGDLVETLKPILEIIRKNMLLLLSIYNFIENVTSLSITLRIFLDIFS